MTKIAIIFGPCHKSYCNYVVHPYTPTRNLTKITHAKSFRRGRGKVNVVRDTLKNEKPATSLDDRYSQLLKNAARSTNRPGKGGRGNGRRGGGTSGQRGGRRGNNQDDTKFILCT